MREFAEKVKVWYELGLWSEERVKNAVKRGKLSTEEYAAVTGGEYRE